MFARGQKGKTLDLLSTVSLWWKRCSVIANPFKWLCFCASRPRNTQFPPTLKARVTKNKTKNRRQPRENVQRNLEFVWRLYQEWKKMLDSNLEKDLVHQAIRFWLALWIWEQWAWMESIHFSFIFHSYFIHISFIFHSYFIHISWRLWNVQIYLLWEHNDHKRILKGSLGEVDILTSIYRQHTKLYHS